MLYDKIPGGNSKRLLHKSLSATSQRYIELVFFITIRVFSPDYNSIDPRQTPEPNLLIYALVSQYWQQLTMIISVGVAYCIEEH